MTASAVASDAPVAAEAETVAAGRLAGVAGELAKLPAFVRRDLLVTLSYRFAFFGDIFSLAFQSVTFYFVGRMVDSSRLPAYGGERPSYLGFAIVGIAVAAFLQLGLTQLVQSIRTEQMMGTLDSLLVTPTAFWTLQIGSAFYDLVYVPLRTLVLVGLVALTTSVSLHASGLLPAAGVLLAFIPVVWGIGIIGAASVMTFKRGGTIIGFGSALLSLGSGAYFPLSLFPGWLEAASRYNPLALTLEGMRQTLLGGAGWGAVGWRIGALLGMAVVTLALGVWSFGAAVRRERRLGTIGQY